MSKTVLNKIARHLNQGIKGIHEYSVYKKEFGSHLANIRLLRSLTLIKSQKYIENITDIVSKEVEAVTLEYLSEQPSIQKKNVDEKGSIPVWITWFQGEEYAPELCKACINNIRNMIPEGSKLIFLTKDNYLEYIDIPKNILDKFLDGRIGMTNFTDIMRYYLLGTYGGAWIDSAIFLTNDIIHNAFKYDFYTPKFCDEKYILEDASRGLWVGGCLFTKEPNLLFRYTYDCLIYFWSNHNKAIEYLVCDYFLYNAYLNFDFAKKYVDSVPINSVNKRLLNSKLNEEYSEDLWLELTNASDIHLINRHVEYEKFTKNGKLTIYGHLLKSNGINI